ncbi:MAG TPA: response regulator transcription factor [Candidatus Dormibacteraeota bacterium]|nr:response regulator transcription factor [Candidatus Dormibacteraeota bacterium]
MAIRVVVAEDNLLVREGIRQLLATVPEVELVAICSDRGSLLAAVETERPDAVLTDIRMPPSNTDEGIEVAARLRESNPRTGVVVLSQFVEATYALRLFDQGAAGRAYLLKERVSDPDQLVRAIREVAAGGSVVDPKVVESLIAARSRNKPSVLESLSPRERDVLAQVAQGKNNAAIATALFLTERGVEKHINAIFSKLGLSEEKELHRRVKAALIFLSEAPTAGANAGGQHH